MSPFDGISQARHVGAVVSGRMHLTRVDAAELDIGVGDAYVIEPGYNAWVTSEESFVTDEFDSATAEVFAQPAC